MTNVTFECSEESTVFLINGTREDPPEEAMATHSSNLACLMKVKVESEKVGLKLKTQKTKIMASGPINS